MAANSAIEWTDHTFNPWWGCTKVAAGCTNCYAATFSKRVGNDVWGADKPRKLTSPKNWNEPLKWNRDAEKAGVRARVFCASMADVFEDWNGEFIDYEHDPVPGLTMDQVRRQLFHLIDATPWLDWLLVTKRPENILRMWPLTPDIPATCVKGDAIVFERPTQLMYRPNVWLLTSVAEQKDADANVPELLKCRDLAPVLGLSCEPLIEAVDLSKLMLGYCRKCGHDQGTWTDPCSRCGTVPPPLPPVTRFEGGDGEEAYRASIDWVIAGGESGPGARPMHPDWARGLRDQCAAAGVPFFFKQWGEWAPEQGHVVMVPKSEGGNYAVLPSGEKVHESDPRPSHVWLDSELTPHANPDRCWSSRKVGKKAAGRWLDGVTHDAFPGRA